MGRLSRKAFITGAVVILGFVFVNLFFRHDLDDELINAVKREDDVAVRSLLARGANANARDMSSRWYRLTAPIQGVDRVTLPYPSALIVLVYQDFQQSEKALNIARALLDRGARTE